METISSRLLNLKFYCKRFVRSLICYIRFSISLFYFYVNFESKEVCKTTAKPEKYTHQLGEKMTATEVDKIFETLDANKDGKLDYKEFTGLYTDTSKQLNHLLSVRGIHSFLESNYVRPFMKRKMMQHSTTTLNEA